MAWGHGDSGMAWGCGGVVMAWGHGDRLCFGILGFGEREEIEPI